MDILYFDIVHDYPLMGGVCEFSERLLPLLQDEFGRAIRSVRKVADELGCSFRDRLYLDREKAVAIALAAVAPSSVLVFPNFQSPVVRTADASWPRIVNVVHDVQFERLPDLFPPARRAWLGASFRETRDRADHIVFISHSTRADFAQAFGLPRHHSVIYNPVGDLGASGTGVGPIGERPFLLGSFHHHAHKNVGLVLAVFAALATMDEAIGLVLTGYRTEDFFDQLARLPEDVRCRITWTGYLPRPDLNALFGRAAAYISLSRCEGFNLGAAEAACHGTPLILSDLAVHREVFGDRACFVDLGSPAERIAERCLAQLRAAPSAPPWPLRAECEAAAVRRNYADVIRAVAGA